MEIRFLIHVVGVSPIFQEYQNSSQIIKCHINNLIIYHTSNKARGLNWIIFQTTLILNSLNFNLDLWYNHHSSSIKINICQCLTMLTILHCRAFHNISRTLSLMVTTCKCNQDWIQLRNQIQKRSLNPKTWIKKLSHKLSTTFKRVMYNKER